MVDRNVPQSAEQRQEFRLLTELTVFVELPTDLSDGEPDIMISRSLDISANGFRVIADRDLPVGSILRTCLQGSVEMQKYILITEVKWVRPYGRQGEFLIGLSLFESEDSDIMAWKEFIARQALAAL